MRYGRSDIDDEYFAIIKAEIEDFVDKVYNSIREFGYNLKTTPIVFVGGGAVVMKNFGIVCVNDDENFNIYEALNKAIGNIKAQMTDFERVAEEAEQTEEVIPADPDVRNYTYTFFEGKLYYRENSEMVKRKSLYQCLLIRQSRWMSRASQFIRMSAIRLQRISGKNSINAYVNLQCLIIRYHGCINIHHSLYLSCGPVQKKPATYTYPSISS